MNGRTLARSGCARHEHRLRLQTRNRVERPDSPPYDGRTEKCYESLACSCSNYLPTSSAFGTRFIALVEKLSAAQPPMLRDRVTPSGFNRRTEVCRIVDGSACNTNIGGSPVVKPIVEYHNPKKDNN